MAFLFILIVTVLWVGGIVFLFDILPAFWALCIVIAFSLWILLWANDQ